ncbi:MAG: hypothetical protein ACI8RZ_000920 [Myxococcota bacterium]|jgi:hypothetical protein
MKRVLIPLIALLAVGCDISCTEIGCISGLTVNLDIADEGDWAFQIDTGADLIDCEFNLPTDAGIIECTSETVWLEVNLVGEDGDYTGTLGISGAPETVILSAWLDGELITEVTESPEYSESYPNGKRCDQDSPCLSAVVDVSLE